MDFKKRCKNKIFLLSLFGIAFLIFQQALQKNLFPSGTGELVNTLLLLITMLGIFIDPTTEGISDNLELLDRFIGEQIKEFVEEVKEEIKEEIKEKELNNKSKQE